MLNACTVKSWKIYSIILVDFAAVIIQFIRFAFNDGPVLCFTVPFFFLVPSTRCCSPPSRSLFWPEWCCNWFYFAKKFDGLELWMILIACMHFHMTKNLFVESNTIFILFVEVCYLVTDLYGCLFNKLFIIAIHWFTCFVLPPPFESSFVCWNSLKEDDRFSATLQLMALSTRHMRAPGDNNPG